MEVDLISNAAVQREIAESRRVREELVRVRQQQDAERAAEVLAAQERLAEEELRLSNQLQVFREDRRDAQDDARRIFTLDRQASDARVDERQFIRDLDIQAAADEADANAQFEPVSRDRVIVVDGPPPPVDAPARPGVGDDSRFVDELRARDGRLAERASEDQNFRRQQILDQARAETNIRQTTQPDANAPRGALVDLQA